MPNKHLADLKPGQFATILAIDIDAQMQHRFCALGFRCGQKIHLLRKGKWLQGPLHVRVGITEVMLRHRDARYIAITSLGESL